MFCAWNPAKNEAFHPRGLHPLLFPEVSGPSQVCLGDVK